ncbi:hypothetical protein ACIRRA_41925 [Nocardia sp. NPDC101769]|uniref:hypothetical protein n=1 Tax=Nocardia sp. NPDC101769 TaxID=3364333 RepID=UPI003816A19D
MAAGIDCSDSVIEHAAVLTPSNIAQFLATHNWTCRADRQFDQVWVYGEQVGLSLGLAVLGIALLINDWSPTRAVFFALGWAAVTMFLVIVQRRRNQE